MSFETTSRKLEQFLYAHDIPHIGWHKDDDGMTVWTYPATEEVKCVVEEYRQIVARRNRTQNEGRIARCM